MEPSSDPTPTPTPPGERSTRGLYPWVRAWGPVLGIGAVAAVALRLEGRRWWCACGEPWPWITDVWTSHCSQHLADPYSITHVSHGLIFYGALAWLRPRWGLWVRLWIALLIAAGWEVLENSPIIIERYRSATMSLEYMGDSIINALADVAACGVGFFIARWLGLVRSVLLFLVTEVLLLVLMRDNLALNVLMLIYPFPGIKAWQMAGQG